MTDLTTRAAVKLQLGIGTVTDDSLLDVYVTQASEAVEKYCHRRFIAATETRLYDAAYPTIEGPKLYLDDDMVSVGTISNGVNGTLSADQYRVLPQNKTPKYAVELLPSANISWTTSNQGNRQNAIVITGEYGYCTAGNVPNVITLAATKLAAWLYQNRDNDGTSFSLPDGSKTIPAEAPPLVIKLLNEGGFVRKTVR